MVFPGDDDIVQLADVRTSAEVLRWPARSLDPSSLKYLGLAPRYLPSFPTDSCLATD